MTIFHDIVFHNDHMLVFLQCEFLYDVRNCIVCWYVFHIRNMYKFCSTRTVPEEVGAPGPIFRDCKEKK